MVGLPESVLSALRERQPEATEWATVFSIHVGDEGKPGLLGDWQVDGDVLIFAPRFRLDPELNYLAIYRPTETAALPLLLLSAQPLVRSPMSSSRQQRAVPRRKGGKQAPEKPVGRFLSLS